MHPFHPDSPVWRDMSAPPQPRPAPQERRQAAGPSDASPHPAHGEGRQYGRGPAQPSAPDRSRRADLPTARRELPALTPTGVLVAQPIRKGMAILTARPEVAHGKVVRTAKAVLVVIEAAAGAASRKVWLPLSKVQRIAEDKWKVPRWLLADRGIA